MFQVFALLVVGALLRRNWTLLAGGKHLTHHNRFSLSHTFVQALLGHTVRYEYPSSILGAYPLACKSSHFRKRFCCTLLF